MVCRLKEEDSYSLWGEESLRGHPAAPCSLLPWAWPWIPGHRGCLSQARGTQASHGSPWPVSESWVVRSQMGCSSDSPHSLLSPWSWILAFSCRFSSSRSCLQTAPSPLLLWEADPDCSHITHDLPASSLITKLLLPFPTLPFVYSETFIIVKPNLPGERNGNPLQYSCLENPMDRGAWWATVHGVAEGQTWLSN